MHSDAKPMTHGSWWRVLLIAALAAAVYANTLGNQFVMDDMTVIVSNPAVRQLDLSRIFASQSWWTSGGAMYRPLTTLTFALNYAAGGLRPFGYHLVNVILHAAVAVMVYLLLLRLGAGAAVAGAAAALFAVHPVTSEAAAYVVGRAELLAALFVLLAVWIDAGAYGPVSSGRRLFSAVGVMVCTLAGMLSKEGAGSVLLILIASDLLVRCRWDLRQWLRGLWGARGFEYVGVLLVLIGYAVWRLRITAGMVPGLTVAMNPLIAVSGSVRVLNAVVIAGRCLWLLLVPLRLSADYMIGTLPVLGGVADWRVAASVVALSACGVLGWVSVRRQPFITWGLLIAACAYALLSNFVFASGEMMAERWLYLPAVGFCTVVACGGAALVRRAAPFSPAVRRGLGAALVGVLVVAYGIRTVVRTADWHDGRSIAAATLQVMPGSFVARADLAYAEVQAGHLPEAVTLLERAQQIYAGDARTYTLLGAAYLRLGQTDKAVAAYQALAKLSPKAWDVHFQLGRLLLQQNQYQQASDELETARQLKPGVAAIEVALGEAYYFQRNPIMGDHAFVRALQADPKNTEALIGRAACAQVQALYSRSAQFYLQALALGHQPTQQVQHWMESLLTTYAQQGPVSAREAAQYAAEAAKYFPQSPVLQQLAASHA